LGESPVTVETISRLSALTPSSAAFRPKSAEGAAPQPPATSAKASREGRTRRASRRDMRGISSGGNRWISSWISFYIGRSPCRVDGLLTKERLREVHGLDLPLRKISGTVRI
jgi:hypothetical protein